MADAATSNNLSMRDLLRVGIGVPVGVLAVLAMVVLPLPPFALDVLFTFNIALSIVIVMAVFQVSRPIEFGVFPTVLLLATLLRLALNVASTRVVLLHGHLGPSAAGRVIQAFGEFVIGGNFAVGVVVFIILTIINFVVVTKGSGRISEVSARFTLDAMPGKQMAIDADLNAGLITQDEARLRRVEVRAEADFYGSMDGASKFVRGDAVAGIMILMINILGGLAIGTIGHGLGFADAARTYTLLTIGDGLVTQIPALLLSTAVAIIVTRMSGKQDMGGELKRQLFGQPRALGVAAGLLGAIGLVPGMPNVAFLIMAALCGGGAYAVRKRIAGCGRQADRATACAGRTGEQGTVLGRRATRGHSGSGSRLPAGAPGQQDAKRRFAGSHPRRAPQALAGARLPGPGRPYPRQPGPGTEHLSHQPGRRAGGREHHLPRARHGHQSGPCLRPGKGHRHSRSGVRHGGAVD